MNKRSIGIVGIVFCVLMLLNAGDVLAKGKFSGHMFGDYYYYISSHHDDLEDDHGFWFRRIYFTYDYKLGDTKFSSRLRLEMANSGAYDAATGSVTNGTTMSHVIKDAYLKYACADDHALYMGISSTPTWGAVEKQWGYRAVEKTPLDLYKFGSSRDVGVALKGKMGPVKYHYMFGNGNGIKSENNNDKKIYISLGYDEIEGLLLEIYGDVEWRPNDEDRYTYQCFAAYKGDSYRVGLQFAGQTRSAGNAGASAETYTLISGYGAYEISNLLAVFARIDKLFDPVPDGDKIAYIPIDNTTEFIFIVFGLDISPVSKVHFIPSLEFVVYDDNNTGTTPDNDMIGRMTACWKF